MAASDKFWRTLSRRWGRTMWESLRIEIPGETALVSQDKTWVKFCLPALHFLIGQTTEMNVHEF